MNLLRLDRERHESLKGYRNQAAFGVLMAFLDTFIIDDDGTSEIRKNRKTRKLGRFKTEEIEEIL